MTIGKSASESIHINGSSDNAMTNEIEVEQVRAVIREMMAHHLGGQPSEIRETFVIRDGFFCGRRFSADALSAYWNLRENQIELYDDTGELLARKPLRLSSLNQSTNAA